MGTDYAVASTMYEEVGGSTNCNPYYPTLIAPPLKPCPYDTYVVQRAALGYLHAAGVKMVDINIGVLPLASSAEYQTAWGDLFSGSSELVPDCGGGYSVTLAFGAAPPSGAGPWCQTLAVLDDIISEARTLSLKVRLAPTPSLEGGPAYCFLTPGGSLPTDDNSAELDRCYGPLYYAAVLRWGTTIRQCMTKASEHGLV